MQADRDSRYYRAGYSQAIADAVVNLGQPAKVSKRLKAQFHTTAKGGGSKAQSVKENHLRREFQQW
jgi:hypothetical protein